MQPGLEPSAVDAEALHQALAEVGGRWSLRIVDELTLGPLRFDVLQHRLGISRKVLTERLKHLVEIGVLSRDPYQDRPPRFEYRLTATGRALTPVLQSLAGWGRGHLATAVAPPVTTAAAARPARPGQGDGPGPTGSSPVDPAHDRVVTATARLLLRQGYRATSTEQIATEAAVAPPDLVTMFPHGKEQLVAETLRTTGAAYGALVPAVLDQHEDLATGFQALFESAADDTELAGWASMCPIGTIAAETAGLEPRLRTVATEVVRGWEELATDYLSARGLHPDTARTLALAALAALEGAFLLARVTRDTAALRAAGAALAAQVSQLAGHPVLAEPWPRG